MKEFDYIQTIVDAAMEAGAIQDRRELLAMATFVYALQCHTILEIGTARGGTFRLWCDLAYYGWPISIDLPTTPGRPATKLGVPAGDLADRDERFQKWHKEARSIVGDSRLPDTIDRAKSLLILSDGDLDFLFIDGDHSYEGVEADWKNYSPMVRKGGWVGFHDIIESPRTLADGIEVPRFWRTLKGLKVEINNGGDAGGIGLIRV